MTQEESYAEWLHELLMDISEDYRDRLDEEVFSKRILKSLLMFLDMNIE